MEVLKMTESVAAACILLVRDLPVQDELGPIHQLTLGPDACREIRDIQAAINALNTSE